MARAYIAISIVTVLWATNFSVAKFATREFDPFFIASFRVFVTSAIFYACLSREQRKIDKSDFKDIVPLSLSGILGNHVFFAWGIQNTTPAHSSIIHALLPVFVSIVAFFILRERLTPLAFFGMALAVAGALLVVFRASAAEFHRTVKGDALTVCGILAFSFYIVLGRRLVSRMGSFRAVALAFVFAVPFMLPILVLGLRSQDWSLVTWRGLLALAYMLVFANIVAYILHIFALTRLTAGQVAAFVDLQPAIGISVAVLFHMDVITPNLLIGAVVALAGVVLVQLRRPTPAVE
ncbi:MAG: DMT family transporter [Planctomycetes bacterium]|nr:DMT family transporter [Planctomycetota bacterium]